MVDCIVYMADHEPMRVAIVTSFTSDYELGWMCSPVNRLYCERHGYTFLCHVVDKDPANDERHPTWNKISLIRNLLEGLLTGSSASSELQVPGGTTHIFWIDADAAVVRQEISVEDLWRDLPQSTQMLIGEDVTPCCLINAGVFCIRVSEWTLKLFRDIWQSPASRKFYNCRYHEQSALLRQLERRGEGLELVKQPFHSYAGGHAALKVFPHVCVTPRRRLNSNRCDIRSAAVIEAARAPGDSAIREEDACDFIFHAAGHPILRCIGAAGTAILWKPPKKVAMQAVFAHFGLGGFGAETSPNSAPSRQESLVPAAAPNSNCNPVLAPSRVRQPPPRSWSSRFPGRIAN